MGQTLLLSDPVPSVSLHDGHPATTSREVAYYLRKRYDNIVRGIRSIMDNYPEGFAALSSEVSNYLDQTGRSLLMYIIFRDGFTLLTMGHTDPEAIRFKSAYIKTFNRMEAELARHDRPALLVAPHFDEATMLELTAEIRGAQQHHYRTFGHLYSRLISINISIFTALESRVYKQAPDRPFSGVRTRAQ